MVRFKDRSMGFFKIISESKHNFGADLNTKSKARELRKRMTHAEELLWKRIRRKQLNGMHFRKQHPYGHYILDFYCFESQLAIEVDGLIHLNKVEYDSERAACLESSGLTVLRFSNDEIENDIESVLYRISEYLIAYTKSYNDNENKL